MRKLFLVAIAIALMASAWVAQAAPPPEGPPGLAKAIAAQERHNPRLLTTPGVVGTAVGLRDDGTAVVRVFTERPGVGHIPAFIDGVPVVVRVTGKLVALRRDPPPKRNTAPVVTISSPADGAHYGSGATIDFAATVYDKEDTGLSSKLVWKTGAGDVLHTGPSFSRTLDDGTFSITASVIDSGGKTGQATVTITVGGTFAQKTTDVWPRPVPIGVSTGNAGDVSAGTIACRVVDASGNVYALSNTHVFAPNDIDGQGELEDTVAQPGLYDAPLNVYDPTRMRLGSVYAYKPINGSIFAVNDIDAAIALTDAKTLDTTTPVALGGYGVPNSVTKAPTLNMAVQKFGRTTLLTHGTITGVNATMAVGYADNWYAWFGGQIIVETSGVFEQAGDSGSLVVTDDGDANPIGLLFAGNAAGTMAIVNPIDTVLQYFGVAVDGKVTQ